jgi:protocadherin Fat 1/2/3
VFQFFVRATDKGPQEKHSDVPVNILIMGPKDFPPVFERKDDKYFLWENSPAGKDSRVFVDRRLIRFAGTVITKLKMASNVSVVYQIISELDERPQFEVDSQGQISLAKPLDFETQDSHLIGVLAMSDSSPPMTALAEVTLKVLDENDHAPQFESSPYIVYLAENTEEGTSIVKGLFGWGFATETVERKKIHLFVLVN